jgi:hypothetical protein
MECEITVGTGPLDSEIEVPECSLESFWKRRCETDADINAVVDEIVGNEVNLSETKLRLYWDRVKDLPDKKKGGLEAMRFDADTPKDVLEYLHVNLRRLRRVFESAKHGIPLKVKGDDVMLNFKHNAFPQKCPQPKWGYGAKYKIMTDWA